MSNYQLSIRCYFPGVSNYTQHYPEIKLTEIPKWVKAYEYTHPNLQSITVKIWMKEDENEHPGSV